MKLTLRPSQYRNNLTTTTTTTIPMVTSMVNTHPLNKSDLQKAKKEELINRPRQESNLEMMLVLMMAMRAVACTNLESLENSGLKDRNLAP